MVSLFYRLNSSNKWRDEGIFSTQLLLLKFKPTFVSNQDIKSAGNVFNTSSTFNMKIWDRLQLNPDAPASGEGAAPWLFLQSSFR